MSRQSPAGDDDSIRLHRLTEYAQSVIYRYRLTPIRGFDYVSPSAEGLTGYTPDEHYADPDLVFELVHPDDHPVLRRIIEGNCDSPVVLRFIRRDGRVVWMEQRNVAIFDRAGKMIAIEGIARDITQRRESEEALAADARFLRAQTQVAAVALSSLQFETVAPQLLEAIAQAQGYAYGALWLLSTNRKE